MAYLSLLKQISKVTGVVCLLSLSACTDGQFPLVDLLPDPDEGVEEGNGDGGTDDGNNNGGGNPGDGTPGDLTETSDNLTAFQQTLHPRLTQACAGCHASSVAPFIAVNSARQALENLALLQPNRNGFTEAYDFADINNSFLVVLMNDASHPCGQPCVGYDTQISGALQSWRTGVENRFVTGLSIAEDIQAYENSGLHATIVNACQGCHPSGSNREVGSNDVQESYFAFDATNDLLIESATPPLVALIQANHFGTAGIINEVQGGINQWKTLAAGGTPNDGNNGGNNPPPANDGVTVEEFTANIYPSLVNGTTCVGCHSSTYVQNTAEATYNYLVVMDAQAAQPKNFINVATPSNSRIATALTDPVYNGVHSGACGNIGCTALEQEIVNAIQLSVSN